MRRGVCVALSTGLFARRGPDTATAAAAFLGRAREVLSDWRGAAPARGTADALR